MKPIKNLSLIAITATLFTAGAAAEVSVQCPPLPGPNTVCRHLAAGDGFIRMPDGRDLYIFGFADVTGMPPETVMMDAMLKSEFPAPTLVFKEGQDVYLTLTNVGMMMRPDLFDPHTVHFHGFANAAPVFDGEPMASVAVNMGASFTYFYHIADPGTYMYHCHNEATEHMQMGMLGNLYVLPAQNELPDGTHLGSFPHRTGYKYAYNDGDGSTYYDVEYPLQLAALDPVFHQASEDIQPLPFADMKDRYSVINGRGYPDTTFKGPILNKNGNPSQPVSSLIEARVGQRVLLRISSLSTVDFNTVRVLGIPMTVVGRDARLLRGPSGKNLFYRTQSLTLGGGEAYDVILDTRDVLPGTYLLYSTNLHNLSNDQEDFGGMMTEILIRP